MPRRGLAGPLPCSTPTDRLGTNTYDPYCPLEWSHGMPHGVVTQECRVLSCSSESVVSAHCMGCACGGQEARVLTRVSRLTDPCAGSSHCCWPACTLPTICTHHCANAPSQVHCAGHLEAFVSKFVLMAALTQLHGGGAPTAACTFHCATELCGGPVEHANHTFISRALSEDANVVTSVRMLTIKSQPHLEGHLGHCTKRS